MPVTIADITMALTTSGRIASKISRILGVLNIAFCGNMNSRIISGVLAFLLLIY